MQTITEHIKLIQNLGIQANENILKIHEILFLIRETKAWKSKNYYKKQNIFDYKECSKMDFYSFIKKIFGVTRIKLESIEKILSLDDGKELFIKYGRTNVQIYYHSTDEERAAILNEVVTKNSLSPWAAIKKKLYPLSEKEAIIINPWKVKYEIEKKKHDKTKKELNDLKKKVNTLFDGFKKAS